MKSLHIFVFGFISIILIFFFIFFRFNILNASFSFRNILTGVFDNSVDYSLCKTLIAEKNANKVEKGENNILKSKTNSKGYKIFNAQIYSRYPFNNKSLLTIDGGVENGFTLSTPVLLKNNILFGKIVKTSRTQSEVKTIFDPSWKSSVYIGAHKIKAVLNGGNSPTLEFIKKNSKIKEGDYVINSSPGFPIGLFIGTVYNIESKQHEPWTTAKVNIDYSFDDIREVYVITNFP